MNGISLEDIGLTPRITPSTPTAETADRPAWDTPLVPGSPEASALYHVWRGDDTVVIDSPPGAGKSTLVARLAARLAHGIPDLPITILAPTNRAGEALAARIARSFDNTDDPEAPYLVSLGSGRMNQLHERVGPAGSGGRIRVRTVTSASMSGSGNRPRGLVIVDEAYQCSFVDIATACDSADQILMVGDPGQIGPVITVDTQMFSKTDYPPMTRAPELFSTFENAVRISLPESYRLGEDTVHAIAPIYDFPFTSGRTFHDLRGHEEIETFVTPTADKPDDPALMDEVVKRVVSLIGATLDYEDYETGQMVTHRITPAHIAVPVAHNAQVTAITARLEARGISDVTVNTADSLQGGQWPVVVGLDPLAGVKNVTDHHTSLGRLCVILSRHTAHLSFITDEKWADRISDELESADTHIEVRSRLGLDADY